MPFVKKIMILVAIVIIFVLLALNYQKIWQRLTLMINNKKTISMDKTIIEEKTGLGRALCINKTPDGRFIVCDFNHNIKIVDEKFNLIKQIGDRGDTPGKFNVPHSADFDQQGNIYIADYANHRIQVFNKNGDFIKILPSEKKIAGPATGYFDKDFNFYVSDFDANSLIKMSADGKFLGWIGAKKDGGVTDGWTKDNEAAQSDLPGGFFKVHAARFGPDGNMYVVDAWNHRIEKFSADGKFLGWIGAKNEGGLTKGWEKEGRPKQSDEPGGFNTPVALSFINGDELVVLEYGSHRIQRFSPEGKFLGWMGGIKDGGVTQTWTMDGLSRAGSELGAFKNPYDIQIFKDTMYIADTSNSRVQIIRFY